MNKTTKILIISIVTLIILFLAYKFYLLNKYSSDKIEEFNSNNIFSSTLTIKNGTLNNNLDKIKDYLEENIDSMGYSFDKYSQYYNMSLDAFNICVDDCKKSPYDLKRINNENNIKNDIDLLNYIKDKYYFKSNIISSKRKIIENYILNGIVSVSDIGSSNEIVLIDGDISGYLIDVKNKYKVLHLLDINDQYIISFYGKDILSNESIKEMLENMNF